MFIKISNKIFYNRFGMIRVVKCNSQRYAVTALLHDTNVSVKSKLQHPSPPGIPRAFDAFSCPGGREFDHHS